MQQDVNKTNTELLDELRKLRQRNIALETLLANANVEAEHLRAVSETSLDAVIISDQDGNIIFWNKRATAIFGYEKEEVLGNPITMLISDEAMGEYTEGKEHVRERGFSLFGKRPKESIAKRKDGTKFPAEFTVSHWKIQDKYYFGGSLRDISEQNRVEEEYETILKLSQDLICIAGMDGYFKYVSPAWEKILGYPKEELLARPFLEFIHPEDHRKNDAEVAKLASGKMTLDFENRYIHKDGSIRIINWTATPLLEKGLMYCIGRDITARKRADKVLQEEKYFSDTLISSLPGVFYLLDDQQNFFRWNKLLEKITGYSAKELQNLNALALIHEDDRALIVSKTKEVFVNGQAEVEAKLLGKHGKVRHYFFTGRRLDIEGKSYVAGVGIDITELKQMGQKLQKAHDELDKKVKQRTAELTKANKELELSQAYLKKFAGMLLSVREDERKNISTALHDELGSMALSVDSQISIAKEECKQNNKQATFKALAQAQAALRKAVDDLRRLAVDLRPPNLEIMGLTAALTDLFDNVKKHSPLKITFRNNLADKKLPEDMAIVIYRVIQEALTNITKHAKAQKVSVRLYSDKNRVHLDITDDGAGCDLKKVLYRRGKPKIGIEGMRERIESLGGAFMIKSAFKEGTQLKATLPKK